MSRNFNKTSKVTSYICLLFLTISIKSFSQEIPEIPESVTFGGITVKFDKSARSIIEEDIKNLMSNKKFWEEKMDRAILHFPIVEAILMDEEVPIDFKYLAVQESSFKPDVVSSSNAVGYWQFKPETAREFSLRVDDQVDERKNISASTHAAAWYLKKNNQQLNNWVSSLYSYYQGIGGVKKVIPSNWSYAREVTLDGKVDRYMLRFFAHKIALEAGIERFRSNNKIVLIESEYGKGQSFDDISKSLGISSKDLETYNHWSVEKRVPMDKEYLLIIPVNNDEIASVREKLLLPPAPQTTMALAYNDTGFPVLRKSDVPQGGKNGPVFYDINGLPGVEARPGDKPKTLAKAGGVRPSKFMRYNDMLRDMPLIPGNVYYLARKNKRAATPFHTARPGDTWQSVSQQYGIRLVKILKYNRTVSRNYPIETGQVLWLTKKRPRRQPIEIITPKETEPVPVQKVPEVVSAIPSEATTTVIPSTSSNGWEPGPASQTIPDKPSGRKKYTPVLVEKSETIVSSETKPSEPAVAPKVVETISETKPVIVAKETNDRVVIITQDSSDGSFRSAEENLSAKKSGNYVPAKASISPTYQPAPTTSVYARQQKEAAEKEAKLNSVERKSVSEKQVAYHVVKSGENYYSIARKYGMSFSELSDLNDRGSNGTLKAGQRIKVAGDGTSNENEVNRIKETVASNDQPRRIVEAVPVKDNGSSKSTGGDYYTVQAGESFYSIARKYNLTASELMALNDLKEPGKLILGQQLRVGKGSGSNSVSRNKVEPDARPTAQATHTVASGETLFRIALNYGTNVEEIKKLNNLSGNSVVVGQKLKVPGK